MTAQLAVALTLTALVEGDAGGVGEVPLAARKCAPYRRQAGRAKSGDRQMSSIVIVGAGVTGLTIAHQLATRGAPVTLVEQAATVGGLARTWRYGDFRFDAGPHRFHSENPRVTAFVRSILGPDLLEIPRKSGVWMFGRLHDWPLRPSIVRALPARLALGLAWDFLGRREARGGRAPPTCERSACGRCGGRRWNRPSSTLLGGSDSLPTRPRRRSKRAGGGSSPGRR